MIVCRLLSYRYAAAFLNLFDKKLTVHDLEKIEKAACCLSDYRGYIIALSVVQLSDEKKQNLLHAIMVKQFELPVVFERLVHLLIEDRRLVLLADTLKQVAALYRDRHGIAQVLITSSHRLDNEQLSGIKQFLARKTGLDIMYTYRVDKKLIAGVRLQGNSFVWEYSIRKSLNNILTRAGIMHYPLS